MQQEHELGQYLRKRYKALLPVDVYPNKIVYAQSTDRERALMSAASVLAGLFPPTKSQLWNDNIAWQPIPIHTIPVSMDYILAAKKHCDRYEFLLKAHFNRPEYKAWRMKYKWLYEYIAEKSGLSTDEPLNVIYFHDALKIQQMKNKTYVRVISILFFLSNNLESFKSKISEFQNGLRKFMMSLQKLLYLKSLVLSEQGKCHD